MCAFVILYSYIMLYYVKNMSCSRQPKDCHSKSAKRFECLKVFVPNNPFWVLLKKNQRPFLEHSWGGVFHFETNANQHKPQQVYPPRYRLQLLNVHNVGRVDCPHICFAPEPFLWSHMAPIFLKGNDLQRNAHLVVKPQHLFGGRISWS